MIGVYFCWSLLFLWNVCVTSDDTKKLQVTEVDTCPTNKSSWEKASRDLNCTPPDRYQCTPNENQTALLEFCYHQPPTFVEKGYCWILSNSHFTHTYSCTGFTEGCPNRTYRSNELYKYQQCLQVNKLEGCYLADPKCPNQMKVISKHNSTNPYIIFGVIIGIIIGISIIIFIAVKVLVKRFKVCKSNEGVDDEEKSLLLVCNSHEGVDDEEKSLLLESPNITLGRIQPDGDDIIIEYEVSVTEECKSLTTLSWKRNECDLNLSDEADKYAEGTLDDSFLRIRSFNKEMLGRYECTVGNIFGKDTLTCILEGPKITLGQILPDGDDIVIEYAVSVSDACKSLTSLSWKRNGCDLNLSDESDKYAGGKLNDSFLRIRSFNKEMVGRYECTARNIFGKAEITCTLDEIQCSPKECQCFLLNCLLLDDFRLCENEPGEWEEKLKLSWTFCFGDTKKNIKESVLATIKSGKLQDHVLCEQNECKLFSPKHIFDHFLQRSGFLDFFLEHACSQNIGNFCRSPGYKKDQGEACCTVSPQQFRIVVQRLRFDILNNNSIKDKTCHEIIEDVLNIPKGVLSLGREGISKYLEDLTHGEHVVYVARGMLVGCEGAGKTSLLSRLRGEGYPNPPSTRGIDVHVNVFSVDGERLEVTTNPNTVSLRSSLNEEYPPDEQNKDSAIQLSGRYSFRDETIKSNQICTTILPTSSEINDQQLAELKNKEERMGNEDFSEMITTNETDVDDILTNDLSSMDSVVIASDDTDVSSEFSITQTLTESFAYKHGKIVTFFDFAGQFAYYACHHLYFSPSDFYILVMDITKKLTDPVTTDKKKEMPNQENIQEKVSDGRSKVERPMYYNWTYLEFTEYWLQSILSYSVGVQSAARKDYDTPSKMAPLILVATHAEKKTQKEGEAYFRDLRKKLESLNVHIDYTNAFWTGFDDNLSEIKYCIIKVVKTLPNWGKKIPLSWFHIENQVKKLKHLKIIGIDTLLQKCISSDVGIKSKDDLIAPLLFLHNIGVILFFDKGTLRNIVTLDVQWFVDAFKHVITDENHAKRSTPPDLFKEWQKFNDNGLLTESLLISIWKLCEKDDLYYANKKELISLMIELNLFTEISSSACTTMSAKWYCPCMNKQIFPTEQFKNLQNSSLLCFKFIYLPKDLFHRLIAACGNQLRWKIYRLKDLCIYQTSTVFCIEKSKILIGMHSNDKILVQYLDIPELKSADYLDIRGKITNLIDGLSEKLVHCAYEVGYMCQKTVFGKSDISRSHFIPESNMKEELIDCDGCGFGRKVAVKDFKWHELQKNVSGNRQENEKMVLPKDTDWVDPEDSTVIAESELLTAALLNTAKSIDSAAQKLSQLKSRIKAKEADMSLNFEEQISDAAKSIASSTATLVKSANDAQNELVAQGKISATFHNTRILDDDGQWSEADPNSVTMKRLQTAGNAVKRATEVLVKAAQQAKQRDEDEEIDFAVDSRKVRGIKQLKVSNSSTPKASGQDLADRSRFAKLGMATNDVLNQAYRDILELELPPSLVYNKVKASAVYKRLRPEEKHLLQDAKYSGYKNFDISLTYNLIRNICSKIPRPTKGKWGEKPAAGEVTVGDDIERIRSIRNSLTAHVSSSSTPQTEFDDTWSSISDICQRLEIITGKKYLENLCDIQKLTLRKEDEDAIIEKFKMENHHEMVKTIMSDVQEIKAALSKIEIKDATKI